MSTIPLTGWQFTDAMQQVGCPKCGAVAGKHCVTPGGRKAWPPHGDRTTALTLHFKGREPWQHVPGEAGIDRVARCNVKYAALLREEAP